MRCGDKKYTYEYIQNVNGQLHTVQSKESFNSDRENAMSYLFRGT